MTDKPKNNGEHETIPNWLNDDPFVDKNKESAPNANSGSSKVEVDPSLFSPTPNTPEQKQTSSESSKHIYKKRGFDLKSLIAANIREHENSKRYFGLPAWGWLLVVGIIIIALFIFADLRNKDRYRLQCEENRLVLQQGQRLPWPFGFETQGGLFRPLPMVQDIDCPQIVLKYKEEAEAAFLDFILMRAKNTPQNPTENELKQSRSLLQRAMEITRSGPHTNRQRETKYMLADLFYREGKIGLSRVESELRVSLERLQEAQKLAQDRYDDLAAWIVQLETLLRSISPVPVRTPIAPIGTPSSIPNLTPPPPSTKNPPSQPSFAPDSKTTQHDADVESKGSGILM